MAKRPFRTNRRDAFDPLRRDLREVAVFLMANAPGVKTPFITPEQALVRIARENQARLLTRIGVQLVRMLRHVPDSCEYWREKGHLSDCTRIRAMHFDLSIREKYGITSSIQAHDPTPTKVKELNRYEVVEADPDDPTVLPFRTGTK